MSDLTHDKSNTPRTDIIAGLWGGGDATIRRQLRRMEDHARQLENELSLAERRLATSEKCRNNLAASIPSSTAFVPEGERKSLAGQAIEMAISALRDIQRRAPGTRTFFDYEAFIERELVPAMAMADKDRQGCIGLMGLLAKEKLKVEELSKPVSAIEQTREPTAIEAEAWDANRGLVKVGECCRDWCGEATCLECGCQEQDPKQSNDIGESRG